MKKEEFVALGISEELAAKAETASLKELGGYNEKVKHNKPGTRLFRMHALEKTL